MKTLFFLITLAAVLCIGGPVYLMAQTVDTIQAPMPVNYLSVLADFIIYPPQWFMTAVIITGALLSATQTILKQIPTERSVKLGGLIGKILDVLTWFAKDNRKGGGHF